MTDPFSAQQATTRVRNRLTGLLLRAIGYGAGDPDAAADAPTCLADAQLWAEMAGERRIRSIAREA